MRIWIIENRIDNKTEKENCINWYYEFITIKYFQLENKFHPKESQKMHTEPRIFNLIIKFSYRLSNYWCYLSTYKIIQNLFLAGTDFYELTCDAFFPSGTPLVCVSPLLPTHWKCKWRSSVTPSETAFQLNSGTKSDGEECEWEDKGQVECAREVFLLRVPEPRRSWPRRGIKALRAPITLTTRREASHRIDLQGFLSWHSDQVPSREAWKQNLVIRSFCSGNEKTRVIIIVLIKYF